MSQNQPTQEQGTSSRNGVLTSGSASQKGDAQRGTGEGVDRKIEKKRFTPKRIALIVGIVLVVGLLGYGVWSVSAGGQTLNVERDKLTVSTVERGPFQEFIAVTGNVMPERTVYLDAVEGGRVEEIFVREGAMVEDGEPILRLSNNDVRLQLLNSEAQLAEQQSRMQQLRLQLEQNRLNLQQQVAQMEYEVKQLEREHAREKQLHDKNLISEEDYLQTRDELQYQERRLRLTRAAYVQDSLAQRTQIAQMERATGNIQENYAALREASDNLTVRAPISGQLTALDAEIGEIRSAGSRFGQIDKLDSYKIRAQIDEFYIERVRMGQIATTQPINGKEHELEVSRVYPQVNDGRFEVDLKFTGDNPESIRRGQSVRLRLELGSPEEALLLSRGGFYQSTGGNWAYVVTENGGEAVRQPIRLGRQNPNYFEVQEGLEPGDRVVTSGYDTFGEADRLVLKD